MKGTNRVTQSSDTLINKQKKYSEEPNFLDKIIYIKKNKTQLHNRKPESKRHRHRGKQFLVPYFAKVKVNECRNRRNGRFSAKKAKVHN